MQLCHGENWTHDLLITSPTPLWQMNHKLKCYTLRDAVTQNISLEYTDFQSELCHHCWKTFLWSASCTLYCSKNRLTGVIASCYDDDDDDDDMVFTRDNLTAGDAGIWLVVRGCFFSSESLVMSHSRASSAWTWSAAVTSSTSSRSFKLCQHLYNQLTSLVQQQWCRKSIQPNPAPLTRAYLNLCAL